MKIVVVKRLLRHKSPVLIFPYFVDTREEEIVKDVTAGYNTELITEIDCTNPINLLVKGVELKKYING